MVSVLIILHVMHKHLKHMLCFQVSLITTVMVQRLLMHIRCKTCNRNYVQGSEKLSCIVRLHVSHVSSSGNSAEKAFFVERLFCTQTVYLEPGCLAVI